MKAQLAVPHGVRTALYYYEQSVIRPTLCVIEVLICHCPIFSKFSMTLVLYIYKYCVMICLVTKKMIVKRYIQLNVVWYRLTMERSLIPSDLEIQINRLCVGAIYVQCYCRRLEFKHYLCFNAYGTRYTMNTHHSR